MNLKKEEALLEEIDKLIKEALSNREPGDLAILKLRLEKSIAQLEALKGRMPHAQGVRTLWPARGRD